MRQIRDRWTPALPGFLFVLILIALVGWAALNYDLVDSVTDFEFTSLGILVMLLVVFVILPGFAIIQPNESLVLIFFGSYLGTARASGFHWLIPFTSRHKVSRRVISFSSDRLKVNDLGGSPIEIGAVVVWRVMDAARATLNVDNYRSFVEVQSETAIRALASRFPYDSEEGFESLRGSQDLIAAELQSELGSRLEVAGIEVLETRLSHLAYAPEIASAMLRRQQAEAVVRARRIITANAVDIVDQAMQHLDSQGIVSLNSNERARLVNNLLVALVSERDAQPVVDLSA